MRKTAGTTGTINPFFIFHIITRRVITVIGTGHVFDLAEPVAFIVQHTWPDAVLIELDKSRYDYLMSHQDAETRDPGKKASAMYRQASRYQDRSSWRRSTWGSSRVRRSYR